MPRNSGINNWQVYKSQVDGDSEVRQQLETIRSEAMNLHHALEKGSWDDVYRAISNEWEARKRLAPSITTEEIENCNPIWFRERSKSCKSLRSRRRRLCFSDDGSRKSS